jgi:hypothetical protein
MLQPTIRRTWARKGQTPILKCYDRHDRLTVISALTVSPQRQRLGLLFDILDHNLAGEDFELFVRRLLRKIRGPVTLVIDRLNAHRSGVRALLEKYGSRLLVEWLPPYAPELNPTEHVWGHTKTGDLANFVPDNVYHLGRVVSSRLRKTQKDQRLLRSFFKASRLRL